MSGSNNLIPNSARTPEERRQLAAKAGKASGEVRRRKKTMRQQLELLLGMKACDKDIEELGLLGIDPADADNSMVIIKGLFLKAAEGDVPAIRELRSILGKDNASAELELRKRELALKERAKEPESEALTKLDEILKETKNRADAES